jgi:hypothetical protein
MVTSKRLVKKYLSVIAPYRQHSGKKKKKKKIKMSSSELFWCYYITGGTQAWSPKNQPKQNVKIIVAMIILSAFAFRSS